MCTHMMQNLSIIKFFLIQNSMKFKYLSVFVGLLHCADTQVANAANSYKRLNETVNATLAQQQKNKFSVKDKKDIASILDEQKMDKFSRHKIIEHLEQLPHSIDRKKMLAKTLCALMKSLKSYLKQYNFRDAMQFLDKSTTDKKRDAINKMIALMMYDLLYNTCNVLINKEYVNIRELLIFAGMLDIHFDKFDKQKSLQLDAFGKILSDKNARAALNNPVLSEAQKQTTSQMIVLSKEVNAELSDFLLKIICKYLDKDILQLISEVYPSSLTDIKQFLAHLAGDAVNSNKVELTDGNLTLDTSELKFAMAKLKLCYQISQYNIL